jgi:cell division control protein 45
MILEREQWHLGYASLLRDCRGTSPSSSYKDTAVQQQSQPMAGRALLLVHPDSTDALATARILSYMLRADGVPHQIRPCLGFERLKLILRSVSNCHGENNNNEDGNNNVVEEDFYDNDGKRRSDQTCDVRAVILINMGANRNLSKLFPQQHANLRAYVFDNHRPYHLSNIHTGKNVVLFNDRPFDELEIPSDGDNLSGDESSTSSEEDSDDSEEGQNESEGEEEFDFDEDGNDDVAEVEALVDSDDDDEGRERRVKRQKTRRSDDQDDDDDHGDAAFKKGDDYNPLDTTDDTADITLDTTRGDDDDDNNNEGGDTQQEANDTSGSALPVISLRELHRQRRNRIRLHYSSGSYHASPSSWTAYTLCTQLRFGDTPDLLWLACVGVTDAYLHGRLDVSGYSALTVDLKRHVGRLFPNELVDRAGRAVYAEDLERGFDISGGGGDTAGGGAMTQISLSENGRILSQPEYKFMLLRHTTLWESILHSNFVASKLQVWKQTGRQRLMELLAKMGFPLDQCRQPWAFVGTGMRRRLSERLEECTEVSVSVCV